MGILNRLLLAGTFAVGSGAATPAEAQFYGDPPYGALQGAPYPYGGYGYSVSPYGDYGYYDGGYRFFNDLGYYDGGYFSDYGYYDNWYTDATRYGFSGRSYYGNYYTPNWYDWGW